MKIVIKKGIVAFKRALTEGEIVECDFNDRDTQYLLLNHFAVPYIDESIFSNDAADEELADTFEEKAQDEKPVAKINRRSARKS